MGTSQNQTDHLYTSHDAMCDNYLNRLYNVAGEETDIQLEAMQIYMIMNSTENACSHLDPSTPNHLLESVPSHETSEYFGAFDGLHICQGNDHEEFLPLVCKHTGVFKGMKGTY